MTGGDGTPHEFRAVDRRGTRSVKHLLEGAEADPAVIPMGMADMETGTPGFVLDGLRDRLSHEVLGYTRVDRSSREAIAGWYRRRHGALVDPDWAVLIPLGPKAALALVLEVLAGRSPGRRPVATVLDTEYAGIAKMATRSGLTTSTVPLSRLRDDGGLGALAAAAPGKGGCYILSNPHNPTGTVWPSAEVGTLAEIAASESAVLVSDEVHGDLTYPGRPHPVAVAVAGDARSAVVSVGSIGKTFNCSGLATSFLLVPDPDLRASIVRTIERRGMYEGSLLGVVAQDAALTHGSGWVDALVTHLVRNRDVVRQVVGAVLPSAVATVPQASFLYWLDLRPLGLPAEDLQDLLVREAGVYLMDGRRFGAGGTGHLRLNFGTSLEQVRTASQAVARVVERRVC